MLRRLNLFPSLGNWVGDAYCVEFTRKNEPQWLDKGWLFLTRKTVQMSSIPSLVDGNRFCLRNIMLCRLLLDGQSSKLQ
jgi:hypothetical protein